MNIMRRRSSSRRTPEFRWKPLGGRGEVASCNQSSLDLFGVIFHRVCGFSPRAARLRSGLAMRDALYIEKDLVFGLCLTVILFSVSPSHCRASDSAYKFTSEAGSRLMLPQICNS